MKLATSVPLETAQKAREVGEIIASLKPITSQNMASDLTVASSLASAAIVGALANVEINLASIKDAGFAGEIRSKVVELQR
jgi:formiminotetrahydrofolate cyclodeaminase